MMQITNDLESSMFLNQPDKIIHHIEVRYPNYTYDTILKFLESLAIKVVSENIEEGVSSEWSEECKECYYTLSTYYENEKKLNERVKSKKGQGTKGSLRKMARKRKNRNL